jgi:hypothetical protein
VWVWRIPVRSLMAWLMTPQPSHRYASTGLASCLLVGRCSSPAPGDRVSPGRLAAAAVKAGRLLLVGWLLAALVLLGMDGRLPEFIAAAASGSLLVLGLGSLVRQQLAQSRYNRASMPERYRIADDLRQPITAVVAVAEQEAMTASVGRQ